MRRNEELFYKNNTIALIADCIYYCWQNEQITDKESIEIEKLLDKFDEEIK